VRMTRLSRIACALALAGAIALTAHAQNVQEITVEGQKQMITNPGTETAGSRKPDVTVIEYFDYNCPYCKKLVHELQALLAQDSKIAIVYKDWPILGKVSIYASSSALAAGYQGKYLAAHDALLSGPRLAQNAQVDAILQRAGVDMEALKKDRTDHAKDIAALLERNDQEAHALSLDGTPGVVVGRLLLPGSADAEFLKKMVAETRRLK
jgi:protein-disulfide isomerase